MRQSKAAPGALPAEIALSAPDVTVRLRRDARARRFVLRLGPDGVPVLTVPPGMGERAVTGFLVRHAGWLEGALGRLAMPEAVAPGLCLPVDGVPVEVALATRGRTRLEGGRLLLTARLAPGPAASAWLKARARDRLAPLAHGFAERLGRQISQISLRDTRSRWGSCSAAGRLSFSWRLAMAPPDVQAYLAAHEAAHLVEMNHSARFWAVLAGLMPGYERPQAWLKREGRALHRYRFEG